MLRPNILEREKSLAEIDGLIAEYQGARGVAEAVRKKNLDDLHRRREAILIRIYEHLTPWDEVLLARLQQRPYSLDYIRILFEEFTELHGDRLAGDDQAIIGGPARFNERPVMVIAQQKGRDLKERKLRNFGMSGPEGYRKALRLMHMAEKFSLPVITFIDTPGADPNVSSEERGISAAIAENLMEMSVLRTPIVGVIIGEGGSGGALGIGVCDRTLMLEHAIYSVIAPEGCAAILDTFGRDPNRKDEAAEAMKVSAPEVKAMGLVDEVLPEHLGGAHRNLDKTVASMREALGRHLLELTTLDIDCLVDARYEKLRAMGQYTVVAQDQEAPTPSPDTAG
jgi:acetyl-CoA carboxylase carboxyl transferase subunit alpha